MVRLTVDDLRFFEAYKSLKEVIESLGISLDFESKKLILEKILQIEGEKCSISTFKDFRVASRVFVKFVEKEISTSENFKKWMEENFESITSSCYKMCEQVSNYDLTIARKLFFVFFELYRYKLYRDGIVL